MTERVFIDFCKIKVSMNKLNRGVSLQNPILLMNNIHDIQWVIQYEVIHFSCAYRHSMHYHTQLLSEKKNFFFIAINIKEMQFLKFNYFMIRLPFKAFFRIFGIKFQT
jgi:hypothetical protein